MSCDGPVLIVEDDEDLRGLLGMVCDLHGINTTLVGDVPSALHQIAQQAPALILMDLSLGGDHDGLEVLSAGVARGCPVVVMSASVAVADSLLMEMGATGVLAKPFDINRLPMVIEDACRD